MVRTVLYFFVPVVNCAHLIWSKTNFFILISEDMLVENSVVVESESESNEGKIYYYCILYKSIKPLHHIFFTFNGKILV